MQNSDTKTQDNASTKICRMRTAAQILGTNLVKAFQASTLVSVRELARRANMSPNTVLSMMHPDKRPPNAQGVGAPRLDRIEALARVLGRETWELLLPDFNPQQPSRLVTTVEFDAIRLLRGR